MPSLPILEEPELILIDDTAGGASCSEAIFSKFGSVSNFVLNNFIVLPFGISGAPYSGLSAYPYTFNGSIEPARLRLNIEKITVFNEVSGISAQHHLELKNNLRLAELGQIFLRLIAQSQIQQQTVFSLKQAARLRVE
jgi:hypothetical protein